MGMAIELKTLQARDVKDWRGWLEKFHSTSPGIWLVYFKDHTGIKSIPYDDSVREALCFGWVDSLIKRLDDRRYARKFTPRQPASKWSESNRKRWRELKAAGRLAPAGLAAAPTDNNYAPLPDVPELPGYIAAALKRSRNAWNFFQELAPGQRRLFVRWIHYAKRPETRAKRIREAIALLEAGKKLGLK
jgi:uncharacterized protein YdeI (YjbR/CyaY-like superfamily)